MGMRTELLKKSKKSRMDIPRTVNPLQTLKPKEDIKPIRIEPAQTTTVLTVRFHLSLSCKIETTVSEYIAGYIKIGDEVDVYVSTLGDTPYKGTVTAFSPAPALGTLTYPITITLDNESGDLMSGMFAEVKFTAEEADDTICIPSDAVIMKNGKSVAVIIDEDLIPSFREVETGIDNGEFVEILSGIKEGETVVISGQNFVEEGIAVRIIEEDDSQTDESKNEENSADVSAEDDE